MENSTSTTSDSLKHVGKLFLCITRLHNFCIYEGNVYVNSIEDTQGGDSGFNHSDVYETSITGSSVLTDIIVQELTQRVLERPSVN